MGCQTNAYSWKTTQAGTRAIRTKCTECAHLNIHSSSRVPKRLQGIECVEVTMTRVGNLPDDLFRPSLVIQSPKNLREILLDLLGLAWRGRIRDGQGSNILCFGNPIESKQRVCFSPAD